MTPQIFYGTHICDSSAFETFFFKNCFFYNYFYRGKKRKLFLNDDAIRRALEFKMPSGSED